MLKKLLIIIVLVLVTVGFLEMVIQPPLIIGGGTFCDEGKELFCWTSIPYWECRDYGGPQCADPVQQ